MVILGLTGSIGMGKSTAAQLLRRLGVPVFESDAAVHRALGPGGAAVAPVRAVFGEVVARDGGIDRGALGRLVFDDPAALRRLEAILHPLVRAAQRAFLRRAAARREAVAVVDVPLLFETGGDRLCDAVVVVSAPRFLQEQRVLARPGMTPEKLAGIRAQQMPDLEKRRRADFVVPSGLGKRETLNRLREIVTLLRARRGRRWSPHYPGLARHARNRPRHRDDRARSRRRPPRRRDRLR